MTFPTNLTDPIGPGSKAWNASELYIQAIRTGHADKTAMAKDYMIRCLRAVQTPETTIDEWITTAQELARDDSYES